MTPSSTGKRDPESDPLDFGIFIPGTTSPIVVDRRVWRFGLAKMLNGEQQAVFVCLSSWRELIVQSLVTAIGRAIGLPIPPCMVIATNSAAFPEIGCAETAYLFACKASPHPTLSTFAKRMGEIVDLLTTVKREVVNKLIILDEWSLNGYRDNTAMLIDPSSGFLFVDHHPALPRGCNPAEQVRNWVHEIVHGSALQIDNVRLLREIERTASNVFSIDLETLSEHAEIWLTEDQAKEMGCLISQLSSRRHLLESLFCQRLGIEEQELQFAP